jgi:hypothetical protein
MTTNSVDSSFPSPGTSDEREHERFVVEWRDGVVAIELKAAFRTLAGREIVALVSRHLGRAAETPSRAG